MKSLNNLAATLRGIMTQDDARAHVFEAFQKKWRKNRPEMPDHHKEQLNWLFDLIWDLAAEHKENSK